MTRSRALTSALVVIALLTSLAACWSLTRGGPGHRIGAADHIVGDADAHLPAARFPGPWTTRDDSVHASAAELLDGAPAPAHVVALIRVGGRARLLVRATATRGQAADAITDLQADTDTIAVSLDSPVMAVEDTTAAGAGDPGRVDQWALDTLGAEHAWTRAAGTGAVVAVIDTGVEADHEDLAGQILPGAEFVAGNGSQTAGDGRRDPNGHGTHVAGIVAAVKGNGIGVAGLAPAAHVLPIRALAADGSGWNSDIAAGILYATDHGADVISMSLGGTAADPVTEAAVRYALDHGVVVVAAAGNTRQRGNQPNYPGAYPGVLAVAATESDDSSSLFSTTGDYVDVAAPGGSIYSTYPGGYQLMSGTSMATPFVAATAALARSAAGRRLDPAAFYTAATQTATDLGAPGRDEEFGFGLIAPYQVVCVYLGCGTVTPPPTLPPTPPSTPTPPAPPGEVRTPTSVQFRTGGGTAYAGGPVTVRLRVTNPLTGRGVPGVVVVVTAHDTGPGRDAGQSGRTYRLRTGPHGDASLTVRLRHTTRFSARVPGTDRVHAATSDRPISWRAVPHVWVGYGPDSATTTVHGTLGQLVCYQHLAGTGWVTWRTVTPGRDGAARVAGLPAGIWRVRIPAASGFASVTTGTWSVS